MAFHRFFVKVLFEMTVNICNELNFSDVCGNVNCTGSLTTFTCTLLGFINFSRDPM